jgi:hypothetical protein
MPFLSQINPLFQAKRKFTRIVKSDAVDRSALVQGPRMSAICGAAAPRRDDGINWCAGLTCIYGCESLVILFAANEPAAWQLIRLGLLAMARIDLASGR